MSEWSIKTVRELVNQGILDRPMDGNHGEQHPKAPDFTNTGIPFIMASDLKDGRVDTSHCSFISEELARILRKGRAITGDVLLSHKATIGRTAIVNNLDVPFLMLTPQVTYYRIKDRTKLDARFLKFYFDSPNFQALLDSWSRKGSTRAYIGITSQLDLPIPLPIISEQRAVAHILGMLDDKIELNRKMNETLEATARAVFKSWFVDFDPVRAKAGGRDTGLPEEISDLFPDSLKDSELGEIPKGWKSHLLSEIILINPTRSLPHGTLAPYLDMANMPTRGPSPKSWVMREIGSGMKFMNGDTLIARITPCLENGKTAFVDFLTDGEVGWGSTEYIVLRSKDMIPPVFTYLLARTDNFRSFAIQQMTGSSGRQRVSADSLVEYRIATPDINSPLFLHFGRLVTPMFDRIKIAMGQYRTLSSLRDMLLPKLLLGELRVPDAERIVGKIL